MRKFGLFAVAAGLAVSASVAKADFVISSSRQTGAVVVASGPSAGTYDIVDFTITNTGTNGTGTTVNSIDVGLYSPSGMLIGVGNGARGGVSTTTADVFETNLSNTNVSWIADQNSPFTLSSSTGGSVLLLGANPTTTAGVGPSSQTFLQNQLVQGIAGSIFSTTGAQASPIFFAQEVVPTGAQAIIFNPGGTASAPTANNSRVFEPTSGVFSPGTGSFAATNNTGSNGPYVNAVPEPASVGLIGLGMAALVARRRRA